MTVQRAGLLLGRVTKTQVERKFTKATKMSKFKVLVNNQKNEGDNEDEPSFGSNDNQFTLEERKN